MNVFNFEFKRLFKPAIVWSLVCGAIIIMFMAFYPSMKDSGMQELLTTKLDAFPEGFMEAFNISGATDFSNIADYSAYVLQYVVMAGAVYASMLGVTSLIKEESDGTIEFLYSKPITRNKIVTAKLLASIFIFLTFVVIITAITLGVDIIIKPDDIAYGDIVKDTVTLYLGMVFISYIFMAVGFLISVFIKSAKKATPIALGIFFATYVIGVLSKMKDSLNTLIYLSPFDYAAPADIIKDGFEGKYIIIGFAIILVSICITYIVYNRKDLN